MVRKCLTGGGGEGKGGKGRRDGNGDERENMEEEKG